MPSEAQTDPVYSEATTPRGVDNVPVFDEAQKAAARQIKPNMIMYTSILVALLQPFQSGWLSSQTNLSQYSDTDECNARPVTEIGTLRRQFLLLFVIYQREQSWNLLLDQVLF
ncbi:unnamed protein product [Phytophthora lilii]|uniref:Unnamed protein product n=1 Tax=Phytophthora lilii TaxID=2077276 RepID=A0A9W7CMY7_9STRA|nr:unnamed protein product [Phytophthora lilii]